MENCPDNMMPKIGMSSSREGTRHFEKRSNSKDQSTYVRSETRCMCEASMEINLIDGSYSVYQFVSEYNHILASTEQVHQLRSQRKIDEAQISRIQVAKSVGICTKTAIDLLAKEAGGMDYYMDTATLMCQCVKHDQMDFYMESVSSAILL